MSIVKIELADLKISAAKLEKVRNRELDRFVRSNPKSAELSRKSKTNQLFGVPLHWMVDWSTPFCPFVAKAKGNRVVDEDGHELVDFCLGDTGAMFGHSPTAVAKALERQLTRGLTTMLPCSAAESASEKLKATFGLPKWQFAMSASDANRFIIRWARAATGRNKVLVYNGCYHGAADDTTVEMTPDGLTRGKRSLLGQVYDLSAGTVAVEFNDLTALKEALKNNDIACVLAEPVMTNVGMVLPDPGYWAEALPMIKANGALFICDETHTISSGLGGYAKQNGLPIDAIILGKPIGGGFPCAAYGMSDEFASASEKAKEKAYPGHSGIGTTLTANLLAATAIDACLYEVMTPANYDIMEKSSAELRMALEYCINKRALPWCVTAVGSRAEFQFSTKPPRNGTEAKLWMNGDLEHTIHIYLLNRGVMITPFHNMTLCAPETSLEDIDLLTKKFGDCLDEIII